jgi:outer membrane efflux protein
MNSQWLPIKTHTPSRSSLGCRCSILRVRTSGFVYNLVLRHSQQSPDACPWVILEGHFFCLCQCKVWWFGTGRSGRGLPSFDGSITAVDALNASRLSDAPLTSSHLFPHAGAGGAFSQLITDLGWTHNLVLKQKLEEEASNANALATREEIVLAADKAFYDALTAQALLQVAIHTVNTRQIMETRVRALTQNKLKSTLDLAFADVLLSQSKLLQLDAQNNADAAMASLDAVLGLDHEMTYRLVNNSDGVAGPPIAFDQRLDLQSVALQTKSAQRFARAQWDQLLPSIMVDGTAGTVPVRSDYYYTSNWWGAIGVNMNILCSMDFYTAPRRRRPYFVRKPMRSTPGISRIRSCGRFGQHG